ncbi:MAG: GFA family protein [Rhizobiaceae bacterium]
MPHENTVLTGGCACRAIRYRYSGKPGFSFDCQCRSCQHMSGTGHASSFICQDASTEITGTMNWYERKVPNGNTIKQGFCETCGSPILNRNTGHPEILFVTAGSLDDPAGFNPEKIVHRDEGYSWDFVDPEATI